MNILLAVLTVITIFIFTLLVLSVVRELIYTLREVNSVKLYQDRTNRIELLTDIYVNASNIYISFICWLTPA